MNGETKRQFLKQKTKPEKSKLRHKSEKEDIESIELFITQNTEKLPKIPKIVKNNFVKNSEIHPHLLNRILLALKKYKIRHKIIKITLKDHSNERETENTTIANNFL